MKFVGRGVGGVGKYLSDRVLGSLVSLKNTPFLLYNFFCVCVPGDFLNSGVLVVIVEWVASMGLSSSARWVALTWSDGSGWWIKFDLVQVKYGHHFCVPS